MKKDDENVLKAKVDDLNVNLVPVDTGESTAVMPFQRRSLRGIMEYVEMELAIFPEIAEKMIYVRPVGRDKQGNEIYAEGLSIRSAEMLANYYPNSKYTTAIVREEKDFVIISASFTDIELNIGHKREAKVSWFYSPKGGKTPIRMSPDRFKTHVDANTSKLLREVILRSMPVSIRMYLERRVQEIIKRDFIGTDGMEKIYAAFDNIGVASDLVLKMVAKHADKVDDEDRIFLLSLYNSIKDGIVSLDAIQEIIDDPGVRNKRLVVTDLQSGIKREKNGKPKEKDPEPPKTDEPEPPPVIDIGPGQ